MHQLGLRRSLRTCEGMPVATETACATNAKSLICLGGAGFQPANARLRAHSFTALMFAAQTGAATATERSNARERYLFAPATFVRTQEEPLCTS